MENEPAVVPKNSRIRRLSAFVLGRDVSKSVGDELPGIPKLPYGLHITGGPSFGFATGNTKPVSEAEWEKAKQANRLFPMQ